MRCCGSALVHSKCDDEMSTRLLGRDGIINILIDMWWLDTTPCFSFSFTFSKAEQPRGFPSYFALLNHAQKTVRKVTFILVGRISAPSFKFDVWNHFGVIKHQQHFILVV